MVCLRLNQNFICTFVDNLKIWSTIKLKLGELKMTDLSLRTRSYLQLKKYFKVCENQKVYEFCDDWITNGNTNTDGLDEAFRIRYNLSLIHI